MKIQIPEWAIDRFISFKNGGVEFPDARYKVVYGGRGGGKSRTLADIAVLEAFTTKQRYLCCREIQLSIAESVKKEIDDAIERLNLASHFKSTLTSIECITTGSEFIFSGLKDNPDKIKSMAGVTRCWVEEAHTISQTSLDILLPTIRAPGSQFWFSYNPRYVDDPVHRMFAVDEPPPKSIVLQVNYRDNPWFPDELREQMEWHRANHPDKYRHIWLGELKRESDALIFNGYWRIAETPEPHHKTHLLFGADWGFSNDPNALVRCWRGDGRTIYIDYAVGGTGIELDKLPDLYKTVPGSNKFPIISDSSRPETIDFMRRRGYRCEPAKKGPGSVEDGIERLKQFEMIVHPRCIPVINELGSYSYRTDRNGLVLPIPEDANNHWIDGLRYATESIDNNLDLWSRIN